MLSYRLLGFVLLQYFQYLKVMIMSPMRTTLRGLNLFRGLLSKIKRRRTILLPNVFVLLFLPQHGWLFEDPRIVDSSPNRTFDSKRRSKVEAPVPKLRWPQAPPAPSEAGQAGSGGQVGGS